MKEIFGDQWRYPDLSGPVGDPQRYAEIVAMHVQKGALVGPRQLVEADRFDRQTGGVDREATLFASIELKKIGAI